MPTPVSQLIRPINSFAVLGDSRAAQVHVDPQMRNRAGYNHFNWGNALSGQRAVIAGNWGVSGDRTDQMLARLSTAIASGGGWLYIIAGVNDHAQNYPTAGTSGVTAFNNIKLCADTAALYGVRSMICLETGAQGLTAAQIGQVIEQNERLREYADKAPYVVLVDLPFALMNPTNSVSALAFKPNYSADGTHEANLGAYYGGKIAMLPLFQQLLPPRVGSIRNIVETPSANSLVSLLANPLFATASGGTIGTGAGTGTVAGSWTSNRGGTASAVYSVGAPADGSPGNEQVMACTFGAANEEIRIQQDVALANWSPGDIIRATAEVSVDAGSSNLAGVYLYLQCNGTGDPGSLGAQTAMDMYPQTAQGPTETYTISLETESLQIPAYTTKSWVTMYVRAISSGAGSATVRVRRASIRKRFAL